jgi:hypothetical protein
MIKDVMVWLDGGISDEIRLAVADAIARQLDSQVVIGLFLNLMPLHGPADADVSGALATAELLNLAREAGDKTEALLAKRLRQLDRPVEIRRFDVLADDIAKVAAREARSADTFVALRPNGAMDPHQLVEGVLFGSGRHLFLVPETERPKIDFSRIGVDAVNHLQHHEIHAALHRIKQQRSRNQVDGGGRTAQGRPHRYGSIRSFAPA